MGGKVQPAGRKELWLWETAEEVGGLREGEKERVVVEKWGERAG